VSISNQAISAQTAELIVQQLINTGVEFVTLAPGSRNGPISLALIAAEKKGLLSVHVRIDERTAAFVALGAAIKSGKPTVVLTTSGTAVANLFPAVIEAKYSSVPLIVLTADRPAAYQGTGANQVINQRDIFGSFVSRSIEINSESLLLETAAARDAIKDRIISVLSAGVKSRTPVHLNVSLSEPLIPTEEFQFEKFVGELSLSNISPENIAPEYLTKKGLIVAGATNIEMFDYAKDLGLALDWPVVVEPPHVGVGEIMVSHAPAFIKAITETQKPEVVLTIGRVGLSRSISELIKTSPILISCAIPSVVTQSFAKIKIAGLFRIPTKQVNKTWRNLWKKNGSLVHAVVTKILTENTKMSGLHVVSSLVKKLPKQSHLHVASSLAARDLELVLNPEQKSPFTNGDVSVSMNRGVNGIDGVVATAIGTALVSDAPTYALLGDIAALHDLNSFVIPTLEKNPNITFIICDNNGGGIFNTLEQAEVENFDRVFGTPTKIDLSEVLKTLQAKVKIIKKIADLEKNLDTPNGIKVLIVPIESREEEAELRKMIYEEVKKIEFN